MLNTAEIIAIVIGLINFIALCIVAWQTWLTRKSVQLSQSTVKESQRSKELANLPRAFVMLEVRCNLEGWKKDLEYLVSHQKEIERMINQSDSAITFPSDYWRGKLDRMISKSLYDVIPEWLREMLISGAQYYADCMLYKETLCAASDDKSRRILLFRGMVERANHGLAAINEMLDYMSDILPRWYLQAPASLKDEEFFR
ncbi:MAG: hypothetical protein Q8O43_05585 [Dehalococcoidia bacterium]|nr:hypothetical protein [Dehalococcoidia bacterium]